MVQPATVVTANLAFAEWVTVFAHNEKLTARAAGRSWLERVGQRETRASSRDKHRHRANDDDRAESRNHCVPSILRASTASGRFGARCSACARRGWPSPCPRLSRTESQVELKQRPTGNLRDRVFEERHRKLRQILLVVDPTQRVVHFSVFGHLRLRDLSELQCHFQIAPMLGVEPGEIVGGNRCLLRRSHDGFVAFLRFRRLVLHFDDHRRHRRRADLRWILRRGLVELDQRLVESLLPDQHASEQLVGGPI